jgi:hypothetical protein
MLASASLGLLLRRRKERRAPWQERPEGESQEGFVISAVLGLLALLLGFTFSLALDRYEARGVLVLEEANAIGTSYLRSQVLDEPHRSRKSRILLEYTETRVQLGQPSATEHRMALL